MSDRIKKTRRPFARRLVTWAAGLLLLAAPTVVRAEEDSPTDGRLEGYGQENSADAKPTRPGQELGNVALNKGGTGSTWLMFIVLSVVGVGVLFKSANRSHLD